MLCQRCGTNQAVVHYTEIINNSKKEIHLCNQCANSLNVTVNTPEIPNFFEQFININPKVKAICKNCSMTDDMFKKHRMFGCAQCYNIFANTSEILESVHGSSQHKGKFPKSISDKIKKKNRLITLKNQLNKAIAEERYEDAAVFRDEIKGLEAGL